MNRPIEAIILGVVCAIIGAAIAVYYIHRNGRTRLALANLDLMSYACGVGALLSVAPEVLQSFAPELIAPGSLARAGVDKLDYAAYILAPLGVGIGLTRRWNTILLERSLIAPAPATAN